MDATASTIAHPLGSGHDSTGWLGTMPQLPVYQLQGYTCSGMTESAVSKQAPCLEAHLHPLHASFTRKVSHTREQSPSNHP